MIFYMLLLVIISSQSLSSALPVLSSSSIHASFNQQNALFHSNSISSLIRNLSIPFKKKLYQIKKLLRKGANPNAPDLWQETALHAIFSIENRHDRKTLAILLCQYHADINSLNLNLNTPLHLAVIHNDAELVTFFLNQYNPTLDPNRWGETPLDIAIRKNLSNIINILTSHLLDNLDPINLSDSEFDIFFNTEDESTLY